VTIAPPSFEPLLRRVTGRRRLRPLLRALGFESRLEAVPPAAWAAYGVEGDEVEVRAVVEAGERGGLVALLIELREATPPEGLARLARRIGRHNPARPVFLVFTGARYRWIAFVSPGLDEELRQLVVDARHPRRSDIEALEELAAREGEGGVDLALRHARALDRSRVTRRFFRDLRIHRARVAAAWLGVPEGCADDRDQLALLLLCRLMFLYFLQRHGHLAGDPAYLPNLLRRRPRGAGEGSFFRAVLVPLFFGALNTRPERRTAAARALGSLPYLNGGLFERHAIERRHPELDLPDDVVVALFDELLERYRFTTVEAAEAAAEQAGEVGIDPEMLGRVFEELMAADRRGASGTFFTPAAVVDRLVCGALEAWLAGRPGVDAGTAARLVRDGDVARLEPARRRDLAGELARLRVLDPACGSGAFLLGALTRLTRLRAALEGREPRSVRREIVAGTLHGVDVQEDAALLCALRLWLALALGQGGGAKVDPAVAGPTACGADLASPAVDPLPNLDRRIRQGDALVDPLDLVGGENSDAPWSIVAGAAEVRRAAGAITPLAARYVTAEPEERIALRDALAAAEAGLARAWLAAIDRRLAVRAAELRGEADARDLFGERPASAHRAEAALRGVESRRGELARLRAALDDAGARPFFSFPIHFAEASAAGFDLVVSNPPWVRAHRWPDAIGRLVRRRFEICREAGWRRGAELAGAPAGVAAQVDLSLLFLERSVRLLAPGGVLAILIPAKAIRSLYGSGARRLLLREMELASIEDHALDQRSIFRADAFAAAVIGRKRKEVGIGEGARSSLGAGETTLGCGNARPGGGDIVPGSATALPGCGNGHAAPRATGPGPLVRVAMVRRGVEPLRFVLRQDDLPVIPGDAEAPWLIAPPAARAALRRMQASGTALGLHPAGLRVRRGVVTGANDVLIVPEAAFKLGNLAWIRAEGAFRARRDGRPAAAARYRALIEGDSLRPLVRGGGIQAWRYRTAGHILWVHDDTTTEATPPPPRTARYLARHAATLRARSGWRPGLPDGALFRLSPATLGHRVAWHDLAENLNAVALPARVAGPTGRDVPIVPLNTVYFIPTATAEQAELLAAYFNSLPVRTFARAIAERAKDAHFRFLAWTIALIPLPAAWDQGPIAARLLRISRAAHRRQGISGDDEADLNAAVAAAYGLEPDDMHALLEFDRWLKGLR